MDSVQPDNTADSSLDFEIAATASAAIASTRCYCYAGEACSEGMLSNRKSEVELRHWHQGSYHRLHPLRPGLHQTNPLPRLDRNNLGQAKLTSN